MKVGDITEPIRTTRGYQLLKLEDRTDVKVQSFEEARAAIGDKIGEQKMSGERTKYVDKLRREATIVWRNDELKKAYEQALAKRQAAAPAAQTAGR
jgi:foldase protein PrsA